MVICSNPYAASPTITPTMLATQNTEETITPEKPAYKEETMTPKEIPLPNTQEMREWLERLEQPLSDTFNQLDALIAEDDRIAAELREAARGESWSQPHDQPPNSQLEDWQLRENEEWAEKENE